MERSTEAGLEVAQQGVDPAELGWFVGVFAAVDDCLVVAVGCGHGTEAGQGIGEHLAAGTQVALDPVGNRL